MKYLFFLFPFFAFSQNIYEIEYFESNLDNNYYKKGELVASDKESFYISKDTDSIPPILEKEISSDFIITEMEGSEDSYDYSTKLPSTYNPVTYFNKSWKHFIFLENKLYANGEIFIESNLPNIDWKITDETKRILGFECKKATGVYKCRQYTVWFTKDINLKIGPWHLNGLPGAILEAKENNSYVEFVAVKIKKKSQDNIQEKIDSYTKAYDKIKYEDYLIKIDESTVEWAKSIITDMSEKQIEGVTINSIKATTTFETFDLCRTKTKKQVKKYFTE